MSTKKKTFIQSNNLEFISYDNNIYCIDDVTPLFELKGISKKGAGFLVAVDRALKLIFCYSRDRVWFSVK